MNHSPAQLRQRVSLFQDLDVTQVQEFVGEGRNHWVYKYKSNWVLKLSKPGSCYSDFQTLQTDLKLLKTYFPELMIPTIVMAAKDSSDYAILQKFCGDSVEVVGEVRTGVRAQLEKIITQNKRLFKNTGKSLDLFGSSGFVNSLLALLLPWHEPRLANLLLKRSGSHHSLFLVDTELLRLTKVVQTWQSVRLYLRSWISYHFTSFLLRRAFKFDSA